MDVILVIDCGSQYSHLIARAVRNENVYSEFAPNNIRASDISEDVKGIIISGGPSSVYDEASPKIDKNIFSLGVPILGICYGYHYIAHTLGGRVAKGDKKEYGFVKIKTNESELLTGLNKEEDVWMSHGDTILSLPEDFRIISSSDNSPMAGFENAGKKIYGLQFHPEVKHTVNGKRIIENFIGICNCKKDWRLEDFVSKAINEIKSSVGNKKAIIALSGGVDSTTASVLGSMAIGKNLTAVYVDTGLMRLNETKEIRSAFENFDLRLLVVDAKEDFYNALKGVNEPEEKRRIIGDLFADIFENKIKEIGAEYLIQGTIYPDRIESAESSENADVIKTHHNVGSPNIMRMRSNGKVIEPVRDLYKDEVRMVSEKLGVPEHMILRQPFPGPGMAVRIEGEVTEEKIDIIRKSDKIVEEEIKKYIPKIKERPWQYFAVLTKSKATGVKGDARSYGYVVAVRIVESEEAMTANFKKMCWNVLEKISTRITNETPVARVVYDITNKPPSTIEWE